MPASAAAGTEAALVLRKQVADQSESSSRNARLEARVDALRTFRIVERVFNRQGGVHSFVRVFRCFSRASVAFSISRFFFLSARTVASVVFSHVDWVIGELER